MGFPVADRRVGVGHVAVVGIVGKGELMHVWVWGTCNGKYPETGKRKGQPCRVLARGKKNSILVEFEDGYRAVVSRYAVRKESENA